MPFGPPVTPASPPVIPAQAHYCPKHLSALFDYPPCFTRHAGIDPGRRTETPGAVA